MKIKLNKLNAQGFSHHLLIPLIAIVVIGGIGAYIVTKPKASPVVNDPNNYSLNTSLVKNNLIYLDTNSRHNLPYTTKPVTIIGSAPPNTTVRLDIITKKQYSSASMKSSITGQSSPDGTYSITYKVTAPYIYIEGIYANSTKIPFKTAVPEIFVSPVIQGKADRVSKKGKSVIIKGRYFPNTKLRMDTSGSISSVHSIKTNGKGVFTKKLKWDRGKIYLRPGKELKFYVMSNEFLMPSPTYSIKVPR